MVACISLPGFELKAALRKQPARSLRPAALAPEAGGEALLGPVTAAAEAAGVVPRMRLGEALATCPQLVLVDPDPAAAEQAWEEIVCSLEDAGFAVEPAALGLERAVIDQAVADVDVEDLIERTVQGLSLIHI